MISRSDFLHREPLSPKPDIILYPACMDDYHVALLLIYVFWTIVP
jgi:hypothetical protein